MNNIDKQYQELLKDILENGTKKGDRTGTGTLSVFGRIIRHNMKEGFPLLTTKKMAVKSMITELRWFLKGDTNIRYLVENGCNIWNGDAYKNFVTEVRKEHSKYYEPISQKEFIERIKTDDEFAKKWGELGPIYGAQWKGWTTGAHKEKPGVDTYKVYNQFETLDAQLMSNPDSRRMLVNAWNVGELNDMVLPPCHYGFQLYTRELTFDERCDIAISQGWFTEMGRFDVPETHWMLDHNEIPKRAISLLWTQRSVDTFLGLPFNIASYGLLLSLFAEKYNMVAEELIGQLGDTHLYLNHIEQAKEQISREPKELPELRILPSESSPLWGDFDVEFLGYEPHPAIKAPLSN